MKNKLNLVFLVLMAITVFYGCKKEEVVLKNTSPIKQVLNENSTAKEIVAAVGEFNEWITSTKKSTEVIPLEDLKKVIEDKMNLEYAHPELETEMVTDEKVTIEIALEANNTVSKLEVTRALTQFYNSTKEHFNKVNALKKHLFLSDVNIVVINETKAVITYTSTIGLKEIQLAFGADDDWYWGGGFGKCINDPDLTNKSLDAAYQIGKKLQQIFKPIGITSGLYTNIESITFDESDDYLDASGQNLYYKSEGSPYDYPCINDNMMNFYLTGAINSVNNPHTSEMPPAGKTRLSVWHEAWGTPTGPYNSIQLRRHRTIVKYGKHITLYNGPSKLDDFVIN